MDVGVKLAQNTDVSAAWAQEGSPKSLKYLPTSLELRAGRDRPLMEVETEMRQCKLGVTRWFAAASRPDICARLAKLASRINPLRGSGVYRINDLVRAAMGRQHGKMLEYASPSHLWGAPDFTGETTNDMRNRGKKIHCGATSSEEWSDAAYGDQSTVGKCLPEYVTGQCPIVQWTSKFPRKLAKSSLGDEVCALSEAADHMTHGICMTRLRIWRLGWRDWRTARGYSRMWRPKK